MIKSLRNLVLGATLALAGCGNKEEKRLEDFVTLSNGMTIPKERISNIEKFMDEKVGKEVTAYYFLDKIKTNTDYAIAITMSPPAIYDLGDGKPFRISYDTQEGHSYRYDVSKSDIEKLSSK